MLSPDLFTAATLNWCQTISASCARPAISRHIASCFHPEPLSRCTSCSRSSFHFLRLDVVLAFTLESRRVRMTGQIHDHASNKLVAATQLPGKLRLTTCYALDMLTTLCHLTSGLGVCRGSKPLKLPVGRGQRPLQSLVGDTHFGCHPSGQEGCTPLV